MDYNYLKMAIRERIKAFVRWCKRYKKRLTKKFIQRRYEFRFRFFGFKENLKIRVHGYLIRRQQALYTIAFFSIAVIAASLFQKYFVTLDPKTVFGFFTSTGAMAGGTLAIIFTFNTILVNFALTEYPPQFFRLSGYDRSQDKIYFLIAAIALSLFLMAFMYTDQNIVIRFWFTFSAVILLFGIVYLIFYSYVITRRRLNPMLSFQVYIKKPAIELLDIAGKKAETLAKILRSNPKLSTDKKYLADQQPHMMLSQEYGVINNHIGVLYDYHDKLVEKKNYSAALMVLDAVTEILLKYIDVRRNSFLLLPTDYLIVTQTDAQNFFDGNFQRMVSKAKDYIKIGNQGGSRKVIEMFEAIGLSLSNLDFHSPLRDNPPFEQALYYLKSIVQEAIDQKDLEAGYKVAVSYASLGTAAIQKSNPNHQTVIFDTLLKLAWYAITSREYVILDQIAIDFGSFMAAFAGRARMFEGQDFDFYLKKYGEFLFYYTFVPMSQDLKVNTTEYLLKPIKLLVQYMNHLIKSGTNTRNVNRIQSQRNLIRVSKLIWDIVAGLTQRDKLAISNRYLGNEIASLVDAATGLLIVAENKRGWGSTKDEVHSQAKWQLDLFGRLIRNHPLEKDSGLDYLDDIGGTVAELSLFALSKNDQELAKSGMDIIHSIATKILNSADGSGYEAPREMLNIFLVGLLAFKKDEVEVMKYAKDWIVKFNAEYKKRYFSEGFPKIPAGAQYSGFYPEQLNMEIKQLERDLYQHDRQFNIGLKDPVSYLRQLDSSVNPDDIRNMRKYLKY